MKILYTLAIALFMGTINAQTAKPETYDLILKLIPDAGKSATWQSAKDATKGIIKWTKPNPTKEIIGYSINGQAKIDYNKQPIKCNGKACETFVSLNGTTAKGYTEIELNFAPDELPSVLLEKLLGKKAYTPKILKKDLEGLGGIIYYEVQFPGKPLVWILVSTIPAYREEQSNDFSMTVFFNKKDLMSRM